MTSHVSRIRTMEHRRRPGRSRRQWHSATAELWRRSIKRHQYRKTRTAALIILTGLTPILNPRGSFAKERHLEQVRVLLISKSARCTSCHVNADGKALNEYGARLHALPKVDSLADRIAALEADPPVGATVEEQSRKLADQDIDQDGVPNWVEILAKSNPADGNDKPKAKTIERIQRVIGCNLCHSANNLSGKEGLAANPHNELGKLLSQTVPKSSGTARPKTPDAIRAAAERMSILTRLDMNRMKRPRKSKATYWQKIRLLRDPTDPKDKPSAKALSQLKKRAGAQRSKARRDRTVGIDCDAHPRDGFLLDVDKLE